MYKTAQKHRISKDVKKEIIQKLKEETLSSKGIIIMNYEGTTVKQLTEFRTGLAKYNAKFKVVKNKLFELALQHTELESIKQFIRYAIGVIYCKDEDKISDVLKYVINYIKEVTSLKIVGGYVYNQILSAEKINEVAKLPSKTELISKAVYLLASPIRRLYSVMYSPLNLLVNILSIKSKREEAI